MWLAGDVPADHGVVKWSENTELGYVRQNRASDFPEDINLYARSEWRDRLADKIKVEVATFPDPKRTVVAFTGLTELFDFLPVSDLLEAIEGFIPGFLLLFFPGERENNTYRFLCARDGWDYLAVPIVSDR